MPTPPPHPSQPAEPSTALGSSACAPSPQQVRSCEEERREGCPLSRRGNRPERHEVTQLASLALCPGLVPYGPASSEGSELVFPHEEVIPKLGGTTAQGAGAVGHPGWGSTWQESQGAALSPEPPSSPSCCLRGAQTPECAVPPGPPFPGAVQFAREAAEAPASSLLKVWLMLRW